MNAKQIMQCLLEGKKVGTSDRYYMYLTIEGELRTENHFGGCTIDEQIGDLLVCCACKVIPEDGP
jgi:hypothetical protein